MPIDARPRGRSARRVPLDGAGIAARWPTALVNDSAPVVRAAAARALDRLNNAGPNGELAKALGDSDETVRLARSAPPRTSTASPTSPPVARLVDDSSPVVRRHAAVALGQMRAKDSVTGAHRPRPRRPRERRRRPAPKRRTRWASSATRRPRTRSMAAQVRPRLLRARRGRDRTPPSVIALC